jgi:hypothetical protein
MRRQFITSIISLTCLVVVVATQVNAQTFQRFEVNIPFEFMLRGRTLPPGKYVVERADPTRRNAVALRNKDEGSFSTILVQRVEKENPSEEASLVFLRRERKFYLFQVWPSGDSNGNQVPSIAEIVRRDRHVKDSSLVRLSAKRP